MKNPCGSAAKKAAAKQKKDAKAAEKKTAKEKKGAAKAAKAEGCCPTSAAKAAYDALGEGDYTPTHYTIDSIVLVSAMLPIVNDDGQTELGGQCQLCFES